MRYPDKKLCLPVPQMQRYIPTITGWLVVLVIFLQTASASEPCDETCPTKGIDMFQFPYGKDSSHLKSWTQAHDICKERRMMLPTIRSPCDQFLLSSFLLTNNAFEYDVWLGGRTEKNHAWEWLDGYPLTNYSFASQKTGVNAAHISKSPSVKLDLNKSSVEHYFICEFHDDKTCYGEKLNDTRHCKTFQSFGNASIKCYVLFKHLLNWYNAKSYCRRLGGYLASSSDIIESFSRYNSTEKTQFWVGLHQVKWKWENDDDIDMTFFRSGFEEKMENDSECMYSLRGDQWNWDTRPCDERVRNNLLVVCQKANHTTSNVSSIRSMKHGYLDSSSSWKIATCSLIVITVLLLAFVFILIVYLRRLLKAVHSDEQSTNVNNEKSTYAQDITSLSYTLEELRTSTLRTTHIVANSDEAGEVPKNQLPVAVVPTKSGKANANTLPHFPLVGQGVIPDSGTPYTVEIHQVREYCSQISAFSSHGYESVASAHPVQADLTAKTNHYIEKSKPKPRPKKIDRLRKDTIQSYENLGAYDVERPVSKSPHNAKVEATDKTSDPSITPHDKSQISEEIAEDADACSTLQETFSTPNTGRGEAISTVNEGYSRIYQKVKFPTDSDGYLQPNESGQVTSTMLGRSFDAALYANPDGDDPSIQHYTNDGEKTTKLSSSQHYTNEGGQTARKKEGKLTAKIKGRLHKPRAPDPVSSKVVVSTFQKHSTVRSVSLDRSRSNERDSKGSNHIYAEILSDDVFISTTMPTEVEPSEKATTKKQLTRKERTKLHKPLSAKNWSENEGAVGY